MKKQLLFLILALFAIGISSVKAQTTCPVPRQVECLTPDALHPIAGQPYTYEVNVPTPPGTKTYTWYVTQNPNFIAGGVLNIATAQPIGGAYVLAAGPNYAAPAVGQNTISITWQSYVYDPLNPLFVVINVVNSGPTCNSQNMKVYKIEPLNAFTLDIVSVTQTGSTLLYSDPAYSFCIHDIVTATYDATAPEGVIYDFGVDYMYFAVTAANYNTSWMPTLTLAGVLANETVSAVEWAYSTSTPASYTAAGSFTLTGGIWTTSTPVLAQGASGVVGPAGECILIRVTLDHSVAGPGFQGLVDEPITLAVDGNTNLSLPLIPDVHYLTGPGCGLADGYTNDFAVQTLLARPDIQTGATMPAPGLLIVKP